MEPRTTKAIALAGIPLVMVPLVLLATYGIDTVELWPYAACIAIIGAAALAAVAYVSRRRPGRGH